MKKILFLLLISATVLAVVPSVYSQTNNVTFTTYYPAPYGAYDRLMLVPRTPALTNAACNAATEGTLYVGNQAADPTSFHKLVMCRQNPIGTFAWGAVEQIWTQNGGTNSIYPTDTLTNPNLKVGIGITTPTAKLEIAGDASTTWNNHLVLTNSNNDAAGIFLNAGNRDWAISATNPASGFGDQKLVFYDATTGFPTGARMVINSTGNVGIGNTAPLGPLAVGNSAIAGSDG